MMSHNAKCQDVILVYELPCWMSNVTWVVIIYDTTPCKAIKEQNTKYSVLFYIIV